MSWNSNEGGPVHVKPFATITEDKDLTSEENAAHCAGKWCRWIDVGTPGTLVLVVQPANTVETFPAMPAGHRIFGQFSEIKKVGTTASALIVSW